MPENKKRQLAAILFADIAGYTALMQKDEAKALACLNKFKQELETKVPFHQGEVIQFYGDGCLSIFNSSIDAVQSAMSLQKNFQTEPIVPARIGIHSGDVVFKEGNVFGDAVNIASRVESLGMPGAVLLSSSVRNQIKNKPAFQLTSLGRFEFKNVKDSMTVYALANEGFPVPKQEEMQGKLKTPQLPVNNKSKKWVIPAIIGILLLVLAGFWMFNWSSQSGLSGALGDTSSQTPLSKEIRQKKVAVMIFENKTGSSDLDDFGIMISDWITQGLMETGEAKVINADFVQKNIQFASLGKTTNREFSEVTGAGVVIQGNYYFQENQIIIHAQVVDAQNGEIIYAQPTLQGEKENKIELLDELTQRLLGFWVLGKYERFAKKPPKYDAYRAFIEIEEKWWGEDDEKCEELIQKAFTLDSTFYMPLLKLIVLYNNQNKREKADSIIAYIREQVKNNLPIEIKKRLIPCGEKL